MHCRKQNKEKVTKYMIILITVQINRLEIKQTFTRNNIIISYSLNYFQWKEEKQEQTTLGVKILNSIYSALITDY